MIRANCRARFTAADFDFIVRTLARSQTDQVSLVDLLSDVETRDSILDHPRLVESVARITNKSNVEMVAKRAIDRAQHELLV
jgi:hypothetical protein